MIPHLLPHDHTGVRLQFRLPFMPTLLQQRNGGNINTMPSRFLHQRLIGGLNAK